MPSENIRSTTPISAKAWNVWTSVTEGPGVNGLTKSPPKTYPRINGWWASRASAPPSTAARKTYARSLKRTGSAIIYARSRT